MGYLKNLKIAFEEIEYEQDDKIKSEIRKCMANYLAIQESLKTKFIFVKDGVVKRKKGYKK